jgi:hypothetical protein
LRSTDLRFQRCGVAGKNLHPMLPEILVPALADGSVKLARESLSNRDGWCLAWETHLSILGKCAYKTKCGEGAKSHSSPPPPSFEESCLGGEVTAFSFGAKAEDQEEGEDDTGLKNG